jgi:hypothetical protein
VAKARCKRVLYAAGSGLTASRRTSTHSWRKGANFLKFDSLRASTHAWLKRGWVVQWSVESGSPRPAIALPTPAKRAGLLPKTNCDRPEPTHDARVGLKQCWAIVTDSLTHSLADSFSHSVSDPSTHDVRVRLQPRDALHQLLGQCGRLGVALGGVADDGGLDGGQLGGLWAGRVGGPLGRSVVGAAEGPCFLLLQRPPAQITPDHARSPQITAPPSAARPGAPPSPCPSSCRG